MSGPLDRSRGAQHTCPFSIAPSRALFLSSGDIRSDRRGHPCPIQPSPNRPEPQPLPTRFRSNSFGSSTQNLAELIVGKAVLDFSGVMVINQRRWPRPMGVSGPDSTPTRKRSALSSARQTRLCHPTVSRGAIRRGRVSESDGALLRPESMRPGGAILFKLRTIRPAVSAGLSALLVSTAQR